jgi:hypothetical protein
METVVCGAVVLLGVLLVRGLLWLGRDDDATGEGV